MVLAAKRLTSPARPFLKWAGGKTQLLHEILAHLPDQISTYYEPFVGGGAVFFALASEGRFRRAVISDQNPELVETYLSIRDEVDAVMAALKKHVRYARDPDYYYKLRAVNPASLKRAQRAARLLYINKTCFNGLYRVNKKGQFNVPFGRYANPRVLNEDLLLRASGALQGVKILQSDFEAVSKQAGRGDAVYFDPPYVPISATSSFKAYHARPFEQDEHQRLAEAYRACWSRGAVAVLSNSDCPFTRSLYRGLKVRTVSATRAINSVATGRGRVSEILVLRPQTRRLNLTKPVDSALPFVHKHRKRKSA